MFRPLLRFSNMRLSRRHAASRGVALVAAIISMLILAGVVAIYMAITGDAAKVGQSRSERMSLDSFAHSVLYLCPDFIRGVNQAGDYAGISYADMIAHDDIAYSFEITNMEELRISVLNNIGVGKNYIDGEYQPDVEIRYGALRGFLDVDVISSADPEARGGFLGTVEFGVGGGLGGGSSGGETPSRFYRCKVHAYDADGSELVIVGQLVQ